MDYWKEHAEIALEEAGLPSATEAQIDAIAGVIESAHEFYGQNSGNDVATSNFHAEKDRKHSEALKSFEAEKDLEIERERSKFAKLQSDSLRVTYQLLDARRELAKIKGSLT
jgi:uridine phosphorylase